MRTIEEVITELSKDIYSDVYLGKKTISTYLDEILEINKSLVSDIQQMQEYNEMVTKQLSMEQRPTGKWIAEEVQLPDRTILNYHCSVCGRKLIGYSTETLHDAPFCHCGADMRGEQNEY